jgi:hypothetical protein
MKKEQFNQNYTNEIHSTYKSYSCWKYLKTDKYAISSFGTPGWSGPCTIQIHGVDAQRITASVIE